MQKAPFLVLAVLAFAGCDKPVVGTELVPPGQVKVPSPAMAKMMAEYSRSLGLPPGRCVADCEVKGNPCVLGYCDDLGTCLTRNQDGGACDHPVDGAGKGVCKDGKCVPQKNGATAAAPQTKRPSEKAAPPPVPAPGILPQDSR